MMDGNITIGKAPQKSNVVKFDSIHPSRLIYASTLAYSSFLSSRVFLIWSTPCFCFVDVVVWTWDVSCPFVLCPSSCLAYVMQGHWEAVQFCFTWPEASNLYAVFMASNLFIYFGWIAMMKIGTCEVEDQDDEYGNMRSGGSGRWRWV